MAKLPITKSKLYVLAGMAVVIIGAVVFFIVRNNQTEQGGSAAPQKTAASDGQWDRSAVYKKAAEEAATQPKGPFADYGHVEPVPANANPNVKSAAEALETGKNPERLTPLIQPKPFDAKAYKANPKAYLDVVEPGRCYQSAQPGPGVPVLRAIGSKHVQMLQGEIAEIKVKAPAGSPVTFTSFDMGQFENKLPSVTVVADERGVATAKFFACPGTISLCRILAGCPMATEQVEFNMNISLPPTTNPAAPPTPH